MVGADAVAKDAHLVLVVEVVVVLALLRVLAFENRLETSNTLHF